MRYVAKAIALAVVLLILVQNMAFGADYITDAVQALQHAPVYVVPGTEGTDKDTAGKLQTRLNKDDNIVLVMMPAAAEKELGDISTIATQLSEKLENKQIIGLAVGKKVVGYAPGFPVGVAADQMRRAESVSNDPVTALATFVQNVRIWQAEHPQPKPSPLEPTGNGDVPWVLWFLVFGIIAVIVISVISAVSSKTSQENTERTHFKGPDKVKDLLVKIAREREQVIDGELKGVLYQMCVDIEKYFQTSSKNKEKDTLFFKDRLTEAAQVLAKYVDVQQNTRYYNDPEIELHKGKASIIDFSQYVLESIRRGHAADLLDYTVNTKILQAQRYR